MACGNVGLNYEDLAELGEEEHFFLGKDRFPLVAECAVFLPTVLYLLMQFLPLCE